MSLMDAMLLEGYSDELASGAREVYVALRGAAGPLGSGSLADPYNGSVRLDPPIALNSLEFDGREVVFVSSLIPTEELRWGTAEDPVYLTSGEPPDRVLIWVTDYFTGATVVTPWSGEFDVHWASKVAFSIELPSAPSPSDQPQWNHLVWFRVVALDPPTQARQARLFWPVASATTARGHAYVPYAAVRISGAADPAFNGDLVAVGAGTEETNNADEFKCLLTRRPTGEAGANATSARLVYGFDQVMRTLPAHSRVHLGPGTFETRGGANGYVQSGYPYDQMSVGFTLKTGQKIAGSGLGVTTLKLVQAVDPYGHSVALCGFARRDHVEVSDLTIDANLGGQPCCAGIWAARVTCNAILCGGYHIRIRRVRAIHFGAQGFAECFVILVHGEVSTGAGDNVIEDCIVEKPSESNEHETSSLAIASPDSVSGNNRGSVVRHNYLNFEYANGLANHPIAVKSLLRDATDLKLVRLETYEPHTHIPSKRLVIRGAAQTAFNGVFPIVEVVSDTVLTFRTWFEAPTGEGAGGQTCIGLGISSEELMGDDAVFDTFEASYLTAEYLDPGLVSWLDLEALEGDLFLDPGDVLVTVTTRRPHQHVVGQRAQLWIWKDGSSWRPTGQREAAFPIVAVYDDRRFACRWPGPPTIWHNTNHVRLGASFHGPAASGTACVTEGNSVYDCRLPFYSDTGTSKDGVLRENYYSNVLAMVNHSFSGGLSSFQNVKSLKQDAQDPTGLTAVVETDSPHRLGPGQAVTIGNARVSGVPSDYYNGTFYVDTVISDSQFTYMMNGDPDGDADLEPAELIPDYAVRWQTSHLMIENNVFEGYATDQDSEYAPVGVTAAGYPQAPPYMFRQWVVRENLIRHVDNAPESPTSVGDYGKGMRIVSMVGAIVDGNVVDYPNELVLQDWKCDKVSPFNNLTPSGSLLHGFEDVSENGSGDWEQRSDLETTMQAMIEEAVVLSFL